MKITAVLGHARKYGSTASILDWIEEALLADGHEVDRIDVVDYDVGGCTGCNSCKLVPEVPGCVLEDQADELLGRFIKSDVILFAAPLYCWGFPSQLKALMDRCYALVKPVDDGTVSLVAGKRLGFVIVAAGPYENNIEIVEAAYPKFAKYVKCQIAARLAVPLVKTPADLTEEHRRQAAEFAAQLTAKE